MVEWKVTPIIDRLNADGPAPQPLGPLTQLPVQKGDTLFVTAPGRYQQATTNHTFSLLTFIASLLQPAPAGTPPGADGSRRGGLPLLQVGLSSAALLALNQLPSGVPKAYLRVLSFNQDSVLVDQRTVQLTAAAWNNYETLSTGQLIVQQDGYVSVYVGNESATDVYFDDVTIEHRQVLQIQENHYDPFGLDLAGVNATAPGLKPLNQYKFNGKEFQTDLGLNWNHQDWRFFDTQLGRWHVVDPEIENAQESWTPYSFGFDNAVRYADANGRAPGDGFGSGFTSGFVGTFTGIRDAAVAAVQSPQAFASAVGSIAVNSSLPGLTIGAVQQTYEFGKALVQGNATEVGRQTGQVAAGLTIAAVTEGAGKALGAMREARAMQRTAAGAGESIHPIDPTPNVNPKGSKENCVNCAIALDATLAGNPASAIPSAPQKLQVLRDQFGGQFSHGLSPQDVRNAIPNSGQRGIVAGIPKPGNQAHVFNAVNQNGVVNFLDGQVGAKADLSRYTKLSFLPTTK